jgi:hypothetical protein
VSCNLNYIIHNIGYGVIATADRKEEEEDEWKV